MTQAEVKAFFGVITSLRDRALFSLIYHYGLRVSEVGLLKRADVDLEKERVIVKRVKGGAWTEQPLFAATKALLVSYLQTEGFLETSPLFPGRSGPLRKRQIQALFSQHRSKAELPRHYTCHSLRHSIATHLLDAGLPLAFVQDHLGHQSIRSTTIYARVTTRHRQAVFERLEESEWIVQPEPWRKS